MIIIKYLNKLQSLYYFYFLYHICIFKSQYNDFKWNSVGIPSYKISQE